MASEANITSRNVNGNFVYTLALPNLTLPTSGKAVFNRDDSNTVQNGNNAGIVIPGNYTLPSDFTIQVGGGNGGAGDVQFSGALSGAGGLIKTGNGRCDWMGPIALRDKHAFCVVTYW
ncbi:MAG: hypothetical protein U0894_17460 [Pirellulales bacterium]